MIPKSTQQTFSLSFSNRALCARNTHIFHLQTVCPADLQAQAHSSNSSRSSCSTGDEYRGPMSRHGKQQGFGEYWFQDGRHFIGTFEKGGYTSSSHY
jgi:hypothetical protein